MRLTAPQKKSPFPLANFRSDDIFFLAGLNQQEHTKTRSRSVRLSVSADPFQLSPVRRIHTRRQGRKHRFHFLSLSRAIPPQPAAAELLPLGLGSLFRTSTYGSTRQAVPPPAAAAIGNYRRLSALPLCPSFRRRKTTAVGTVVQGRAAIEVGIFFSYPN